MRLDEILDKAADLYDTGQLKWIQGDEFDNNGGGCMAHATLIATGYPIGLRQDPSDEYEEHFIASMNARRYASTRLPTRSIATWNDTPGRTKQEVTDKLRELAKQYREETQV